MGVLPLVFDEGMSWQTLGLTGAEMVTIRGLADIKPRQRVAVTISDGGKSSQIEVLCRIDTEEELGYYRNGGILPFVLRNLAKAA
jgi:aconitate hydratase